MKLLDELNTIIIPAGTARKLTINGITKPYPVYKIKTSALYYNEQNDRIASWISQYKDLHGDDALEKLSREEYNDVIEKFIVSSNQQAIEKTQSNISLVGQREAGVVLNDGRVIDGNRRFTCIRRINKKNENQDLWFEACILDMDINNNKKQIKMLELTIQHGEEKKVDYNHVEKLIGIYRDIVETELLTIAEYAESTNESLNEVKKKVESAKLLAEFLEFINMPKQYHVAREYQIVALINDLQELIRRIPNDKDKDSLKKVVYMNFVMNAFTDERAYITNLTKMLNNNSLPAYLIEQIAIYDKWRERFDDQKPDTYLDLNTFVNGNEDILTELKYSNEDAIFGSKKKDIRNKPATIIEKTAKSIRDIDVNILDKLTPVEKARLTTEVTRVDRYLDAVKERIGVDTSSTKVVVNKVDSKTKNKNYTLLPSKFNELLNIKNADEIIRSLFVVVKAEAYCDKKYKLFFIDEDYNVISDEVSFDNTCDEEIKVELASSASKFSKCYLVIKQSDDKDNEARQLIEFSCQFDFVIDMNF